MDSQNPVQKVWSFQSLLMAPDFHKYKLKSTGLLIGETWLHVETGINRLLRGTRNVTLK